MATITIIEVARAAGVSKTTASDILRRAGLNYNADTVEHVQQTAARLGYQANAAARLLRQEKTNLIGIAVGVQQRPHINRLAAAAHGECLKRGYQPALFEPLHLMPQQHFSPFPSPEMLAGLLSIDLSMGCTLPDFYALLRETMPVVALYSVAVPTVDEVTTDFQAAIDIAVDHVVQLGHRRIAYAYDPKATGPGDLAKKVAWKEIGKRFAAHMEPCDIKFSVSDGIKQRGGIFIDATYIGEIAEQIVRDLQTYASPPTALVCPSDEVALSVQGRLLRAGWKLPRQLSIVGFDGIDFCEYSQPTLTTVAQDVEGIAKAAFDQLLHGMKALDTGQTLSRAHRRIAPYLVVRESTAPPPS